MNGITFSTLFHIITWNLMLKLSRLCNKYSGNTYAKVEIHAEIQWSSCVIWNHFPRFGHTHTHIYIYIYVVKCFYRNCWRALLDVLETPRGSR